ncbi:hypothetical protein G7074_15640 [Pedobacter sp. HDW13]|uniref:hypothetical protein n=1 Tax=Pedobacter sp. HDW13 TaxID=2714940 RepID=UPI00140E6F2F|nr:hypothetical protein [Pedobacter sp. HDW13]QIL40572.1 hypothetical protein G7074_15640 [Pedobacter sp. HDW13]
MNNKPIAYLILSLLSIGVAAYLYGVWIACSISWAPRDTPVSINSFLSSVVSSIAAVLATNLGAVLGISITKPQSPFGKLKNWTSFSLLANDGATIFQIIACFVYVLSLLAAAIVWVHTGFETESTKIISLIPEMTKSLVGVIIGVMAISLNVKPLANKA